MDSLPSKNWHALSRNESVEILESNTEKGLDSREAKQRRQTFGDNSFTVKSGKGPVLRFLLQLHQPLIYILIAAGVITAGLQEWIDSSVIFGVVLANAIIGFIQESKAENALAALANTMVSEATVLRDGNKKRIASSKLVPGDIVLLQSGDKVPSDLRLLESKDLQVDESALTGESLPVAKSTEQLDVETVLADRENMAYGSTNITYGQGTGIVIATGDHTEVGRISNLISTAQDLATPLTQKIGKFSQLLLYGILLLAALTVLVGAFRGQPLFDMFMAAVALAVGAIPEGLPAAVTITLAIGVSRMAKRRAIIRKLPAVETLGSTTVICSDKTGTLTENQMTVQAIVAGDTHYEVSGVGYAPLGSIVRQHDGDTDSSAALEDCLLAGMLCNDSVLVEKDEEWQVQGDPTEGSLLVAAIKGGLDLEKKNKNLPRLDSIPFESQHQYMATLHDTGGGKPRRIFVKGAVEQLLPKCTQLIDSEGNTVAFDSEHTKNIQKDVANMAERGLRVLAFACRETAATTKQISHDDVAGGLTFLGLQGMIDPPRAEAVKAVKICQKAGIRVKMITGDHPVTAAAIAGQIGLAKNRHPSPANKDVLTGLELEKLSDAELIDAAEQTDVFARATPEQKIRLVRALQSRGHVVAMTGDGVNDAPALKQADIGVAMGITGTDVSKEAADMILTDDNFSSIEAAVEEGRAVFDNLTKFIVWTLPTNLGEGLVILTAIFLGITLPILPVQILWINMTTAGFLGLMLAFEPKEPGIMERRPRDPEKPILTRALIIRIFLVGTLLLIGSFGLFQWELAKGASVEQARTAAVNTFVIMELFYLFNCRSLSKSILQLGFLTNLWVFIGVGAMLVLQLAYTYIPLMHTFFHSAPLAPIDWLYILIAGFVAYSVIEVEKSLRNRLSDRTKAQ